MKPTYPTARKTLRILRTLQQGAKLTVRASLVLYNVYALSQEVGRLKALGWKIKSDFIKTSDRTRVKRYWL